MEPTVRAMPPPTDIESDLVDLADVPLAELPGFDAQQLAPVLRRMLRRVDDPESVTSGYNPQRLD